MCCLSAHEFTFLLWIFTTQVSSFRALYQILPDMTSIVAKWQSLTKKEKTEGEGKTTKNEGSAEQTDTKNEDPGNNSYRICILFVFISPVKQRRQSVNTNRLTHVFNVEQLQRQPRSSC